MLRSSKATVASTKSGQWGLEKQALSSITRHTNAQRVGPPDTVIVFVTQEDNMCCVKLFGNQHQTPGAATADFWQTHY